MFTSTSDPLVTAALSVLTENTDNLSENLDSVMKLVAGLKVGDKTNFGTVTKIETNSISFKAKDTGVTKIQFKDRKMGSKEFILDRLLKITKEEVELDEGKNRPLPKEIEDYANKIEMYKSASVVYNGMMDIFGNLGLPKQEINKMVFRALDDLKRIRLK